MTATSSADLDHPDQIAARLRRALLVPTLIVRNLEPRTYTLSLGYEAQGIRAGLKVGWSGDGLTNLTPAISLCLAPSCRQMRCWDSHERVQSGGHTRSGWLSPILRV